MNNQGHPEGNGQAPKKVLKTKNEMRVRIADLEAKNRDLILICQKQAAQAVHLLAQIKTYEATVGISDVEKLDKVRFVFDVADAVAVAFGFNPNMIRERPEKISGPKTPDSMAGKVAESRIIKPPGWTDK